MHSIPLSKLSKYLFFTLICTYHPQAPTFLHPHFYITAVMNSVLHPFQSKFSFFRLVFIHAINCFSASSESYAAIHARAFQGVGGTVGSKFGITESVCSSKQVHRDDNCASVDLAFVSSERALLHTKWRAVFTSAHNRGKTSSCNSLDSALRASYDAISQVSVILAAFIAFP